MTAARTPELTATEQAQLDAYEAAAYAEDSLRERVARAMAECDGYTRWDSVTPPLQERYRRLADAALAVVRTPVDGSR